MSTFRCGLSRRQVLSRAGGLLAAAAVPPLFACAAKDNAHQRWVSAHGDESGRFGLGWVDASSGLKANPVGNALTGFRGHGAAQHPARPDSVLMFARRPGTRGIEIDLISGTVVGGFDCSEGHHLFGHGCFSPDGSLLFTTEVELEKGSGKIVVRDARNYQLMDEWPSYGIGPHELKLLPDGRTLVVANGGILTHPQRGREKLNLDSMVSTLTYIDLSNGHKLGEFRLPEPKASIRHLDVTDDGAVVFATQMQREVAGHNRMVALGGVHKPGGDIVMFDQPAQIVEQMSDYMGSVAVSDYSRIAGFASPRGNLVAFWHIDDGRFVGYHRLRDVCGIAIAGDQRSFVISNSFGQLRELDAVSLKENRSRRVRLPQFRWDNHLLVLGSA